MSLADSLWPVLKEATSSANEIALKIKAATSGKDDKISAILTTSDDADIAKWREDDAKIQAKIDEAVAKLAEARAAAAKRAESLLTETDDFDVEKGKAEFLTKRQEVTSVRKTILLILKNDEKAFAEGVEKNGIVEILSLRGSGGATSGSVGTRKPRLSSATVNGVALDKATFTTLAQKTGVDVDLLKSEAFKAAGTEDLKSKADTEISFTVVGPKNETLAIVLVPSAGNAKPEAEVSESTDSDESDSDDDE